MTDEAILSALWGARGEIPVSQYAITSLKSLSRDEKKRAAELLKQYADKPECPHTEIRITKISEDTYKFIKSESLPADFDMPKDKPLPSQNEGRTDDFLPTVPAELKALRQWVVWRDEKRDGKPTKVPYQISGNHAQVNNSDTWTDFNTVVQHRGRFAGVGFVFSESDPYCGIDLDNCMAEDGNIKTWAQEIVEKLKSVSYGEVSPSGKGIKFWLRARLPANIKHKVYLDTTQGEAIEIYDKGRFFAVTGKGKGTISDGQAVVDWLCNTYLAKPKTDKRSASRPPTASTATVDEIVQQIRQSRQSAKFNTLMDGNTTGYGSQSEADLALCSVVAFWTQDPTVIDAIFRQSRLMRNKWDEKHRADGATYGEMTIEEALDKLGEVYTPHNTPARTRTSPKSRSWTKPQPRRWI